MLEEFSYFGEEIAKEIVITNTNLIAQETTMMKPVPEGFYPPTIDNAEEMVEAMTYEKAHKIYGDLCQK